MSRERELESTNRQTSAACGCGAASKTRAGRSLSLPRVQTAAQRAEQLLAAKLGEGKRLLEETRVHFFDRGFGVGAWAATDTHLVLAGAGAVDRVPIQSTVAFDLSFFTGTRKDDILWVELEVSSPGRRALRAPLRGIGVLRDPHSGHLLRVEEFELAADLLAGVDLEEIAKAIACILACVGLFCALVCAAACVAIIACIACLGACVGAELELFLACVEACHIAVGATT